jgi:hypothetical protein
MWLLNTHTIELEQFFEARAPPYAILSHTWGEDEVTFQEMQANEASTETKSGYKKLWGCCVQAAQDGFDYAWVDTCW